MAGGIDLFAGREPIAGINLFKSDKNPLNQLDMGVEDVIGEQGLSAGTQVNAFVQTLASAILGLTGDVLEVGEELWTASYDYLSSFFGDVEDFLGVDVGQLGSEGFDLTEVLVNFIETNLWPQDLLGPMDPVTKLLQPLNIPGLDATKIVSGLFPQSQVQDLEDDLNNIWDALASGDVQGVIDAIVAAMGGPDTGNDTTDVEYWLTQIPGVNVVSELLATVIPGLDATKIVSGLFPQSQIQDLESDLDSIWGALASGDPQEVIDALMNAMNYPGTGYTAEDLNQGFIEMVIQTFSPVNAENLFNLVPPQLIGEVPVGHIGDGAANLLTNPWFENLDSIESSVYEWDPAVSHSPTGGSAKVTADGSGAKDLLSNLIPVTKDQTIQAYAWVKREAMAGSGTPVQLGLTCYLNGSATAQPILQSIGVTPPSVDWTQLSGTYTIPANVDAVRLRMTVAPAATAGTVWWSDTSLSKTGLLQNILVAGEQAGKTLADDLQGIGEDISNAFDQLIDKAAQADLAQLMQVLGGTFQQIDDRLKSFLDGLSPLNGNNVVSGSVADDFVPGVVTTLENIVTQLLGINQGENPFSHTDSATALSHVADTLAGINANVLRVGQELTSVKQTIAAMPPVTPIGKTGQDNFERTGSTPGPDWGVTYPVGSGGTVGCDGHNLAFAKSGMNPRVYVARYKPLICDGDYQQWMLVLDNSPDNPLLSGLTGNPAYNDVLGRMSEDNLNFIRFRMGAGRAWINRVVNGVESEIKTGGASYSGADPGPGSALTLVCGLNGVARYFEGRHNGNLVISVTETGTASALGTNFRQGGCGGMANNWPFFLTQSAPSRIRQWGGGDQ
jgi:hypothetical protein